MLRPSARLTPLPLALGIVALGLGCRTLDLTGDPIPAEWTRAALERMTPSASLNAAVEAACRETVAQHAPDLADMDHIWATVIDLNRPLGLVMGSWHGDEQVYPASVIKTVFMVHVFQKIAARELVMSPRLDDILRRMIRVSENIATQHVVDLLSGVTNGQRIENTEAYDQWVFARNTTNRLMRQYGFRNMNANQKTWDELPAPDSVELQFLGGDHFMGYENGNRLTTNDIARLMALIERREIVSPGACEAMLDLMERRDRWWRYGDEHRPIGAAMPWRSHEWSKSGSTGRFRHDSAIIALPDGRRFAFAVFTLVNAREGLERDAILGDWARAMLARLP
jgi:hypothetical protein